MNYIIEKIFFDGHYCMLPERFFGVVLLFAVIFVILWDNFLTEMAAITAGLFFLLALKVRLEEGDTDCLSNNWR